MTNTKPRAVVRSRTGPLLYWLLVVCGLTGISMLRFDTPREVAALWIGSVLGVGIGQLLGALRVRPWVPVIATIGTAWFGTAFYFVLDHWFGWGAETVVLTFFPAAVGGYLSLSERGALAAFWYPAMLWMVVILDGPSPGALDMRAGTPMLVGLAALFVAFVRARETRRVAIWQSHGAPRLASPRPRTVLASSPLRGASEVVWSAAVSASALVLAAWIAPHLWQKDVSKRAHEEATLNAAARAEALARAGQTPCCHSTDDEAPTERVREYLPLTARGKSTPPPPTCQYCATERTALNDPYGYAYGGGAWTGGSSASASTRTGYGTTYGSGSTYPTPTTTSASAYDTPPPVVTDPYTPPAPTTPTTTTAPATPLASSHAPTKRSVAAPIATTAPLAHGSEALDPAPPPPVPVVVDTSMPWQGMLGLSLIVVLAHVVVRVVRRQLTLRHLASPFWNETIDQRVSNLWERMLIGLRDAGIVPRPGEEPQALASRVGIAGMETCATVLDRVRHGVRLEADDLASMASASAAVYRAARAKAGVVGRAAAVLRWPLA